MGLPTAASLHPTSSLPEDSRVPASSPSLSASAGDNLPAYELKFLVTEAQARDIEKQARQYLAYDPHAEPSRGNAYHVTSLYCDTAERDVLKRLGVHKRRKHRLRRYEAGPDIFLERKTKWGDRVKKRRTMIPVDELPWLAPPMSVAAWPGHWFHRHLVRRRLAPVCRITYERVALFGASTSGPMRLTFDRELHGALTSDWNLDLVDEGLRVLTDVVICEFKYQALVPALFKEIIQTMHLTPRPVSKYRTLMQALGQGT